MGRAGCVETGWVGLGYQDGVGRAGCVEMGWVGLGYQDGVGRAGWVGRVRPGTVLICKALQLLVLIK